MELLHRTPVELGEDAVDLAADDVDGEVVHIARRWLDEHPLVEP